MATYLGRKGYSILKENLEISEQELIRKELKVTPFVPKSSPVKPQPFSVYRESSKKLYIPRFYGFKHYGNPPTSKLPKGDTINVTFKGTLREHQKKAFEAFLKCAKKRGCGLLELFCGAGKTVIALAILAELGVKTLIVVHKTFLMNQWTERIAQFLPSARVGRIQGEIMDIENKDIVLGMLQSISMKEYPSSLLDGFGFAIIDEVHHISAEVFSRALFKVVTRHMLGLSATMKRKDGLTRVFKMFLGDVVYKKERERTEEVLVKAIHYGHNSEEYMKEHLNFRGHVNYSSMIKQLCEFVPRSEFIIQLLQNILTWHDGQQLMVIGHNRSLLMYLFERISEIGFATSGYYLGGMKEADLKKSEDKNIIIATYAMAAEGLDIKSLTTLVMVTPKTDVCQAVGRILRRKSAHHLVVDIVDAHPIFKRQWAKRLSFYKKQHYKIYESTKDTYMKDEWEQLEGRKKRSNKVNMKSKLHIGKCLISDD